MRPFSSRAKVIIEYDIKEGRYVVNEKDKKLLREFKITEDNLRATTSVIEGNVRLRPFECRYPLYKRIAFKLFSFVLLLVTCYIFLLLLTMALFNFVLLGVFLYELRSLYYYLAAYSYTLSYNWRMSALKAFIEQENDRWWRRERSVEVCVVEEGRYLEI